jgi:hypothetical protein
VKRKLYMAHNRNNQLLLDDLGDGDLFQSLNQILLQNDDHPDQTVITYGADNSVLVEQRK